MSRINDASQGVAAHAVGPGGVSWETPEGDDTEVATSGYQARSAGTLDASPSDWKTSTTLQIQRFFDEAKIGERQTLLADFGVRIDLARDGKNAYSLRTNYVDGRLKHVARAPTAMDWLRALDGVRKVVSAAIIPAASRLGVLPQHDTMSDEFLASLTSVYEQVTEKVDRLSLQAFHVREQGLREGTAFRKNLDALSERLEALVVLMTRPFLEMLRKHDGYDATLLGIEFHDLNNLVTALNGHIQLWLTRSESHGSNDYNILNVQKNVGKVIEATMKLAEGMSDRWKGKIRTFISPDVQELPFTDIVAQRRLERVLQNIFQNAVKYDDPTKAADKNGLTMIMTRDADILNVRIVDRGRGMKPDDLAQFGQKGFRAEEIADKISGTGLGSVSIIDNLFKLGARFVKVSSSHGQGMDFEFALPENMSPLPSLFSEKAWGESDLKNTILEKWLTSADTSSTSACKLWLSPELNVTYIPADAEAESYFIIRIKDKEPLKVLTKDAVRQALRKVRLTSLGDARDGENVDDATTSVIDSQPPSSGLRRDVVGYNRPNQVYGRPDTVEDEANSTDGNLALSPRFIAEASDVNNRRTREESSRLSRAVVLSAESKLALQEIYTLACALDLTDLIPDIRRHLTRPTPETLALLAVTDEGQYILDDGRTFKSTDPSFLVLMKLADQNHSDSTMIGQLWTHSTSSFRPADRWQGSMAGRVMSRPLTVFR